MSASALGFQIPSQLHPGVPEAGTLVPLDEGKIEKLKDAIDAWNAKGQVPQYEYEEGQGCLIVNDGSRLVCVQELVSPYFDGWTDPGGVIIGIDGDEIDTGTLVDIINVLNHEYWHCVFISENPEFWGWAWGLQQCYDDHDHGSPDWKACVESKQRGLACGEAKASAEGAKFACENAKPKCGDVEPCEEPFSDDERSEWCAKAGQQQEDCVERAGPPPDPAPEVELPPEDPNSDPESVPVGGGECGLTSPPGDVPIPIVVCPQPCDC